MTTSGKKGAFFQSRFNTKLLTFFSVCPEVFGLKESSVFYSCDGCYVAAYFYGIN